MKRRFPNLRRGLLLHSLKTPNCRKWSVARRKSGKGHGNEIRAMGVPPAAPIGALGVARRHRRSDATKKKRTGLRGQLLLRGAPRGGTRDDLFRLGQKFAVRRPFTNLETE